MASNLKLVNELYQETIEKITSSGKEWLSFLDCSSMNYKYLFHEKLLIYAQKPDAIACAEFDIWTKGLKRRLKKDTIGIALLYEKNGYPRLRYVFDISDTYSIAKKKIYLWKYEDKYFSQLIDILSNNYDGLDKKNTIINNINVIAKSLVEDIYIDYFKDLLENKEDSKLNYLDNDDIAKIFTELFIKSVTYSVINRCHLNAFAYFDEEEFEGIKNFSNINSITILGNGVSEITRTILNDIANGLNEIKIKQIKENNIRTFAIENSKVYNDVNKRRKDDNENNLYKDEQLPNSQFNSEQDEGDANREIWNNEARVFKTEQESSISKINNDESTSESFEENTGRISQTNRDIDDSNAGTRESNREDETAKSNEMGRIDEQYQDEGRRNSSERIDIQLERFPGRKKGLNYLGEYTCNRILSHTTFLKETNKEIIKFFSDEKDNNKRGEYLKSIFNDDYSGVLVNNKMYGYKKYDDGLLFWDGNYLTREYERFITWEELTYHYEAMILLHQLNNSEKELEFTDEFVNKFLTSSYSGRKFEIYNTFSNNHSLNDKAKYLKDLYGIGGSSSTIRGSGIGYDYNGKGITFYSGYLEDKIEQTFNWNNIAKRITALIAIDLYFTSEEKEKYDTWLKEKNERIDYQDYSESLGNELEYVDDFTDLEQNRIKEVYDIAIKLNEIFWDTDLTSYENNYRDMSETEIIDNIYNSLFNSLELNEVITYLQNCLYEVDDEYANNIITLLEEIDSVFPPYEYKIGDKLEFGKEKYEITSIDDVRVSLYDYQYPLFKKEYTREKFDKLLKEYPNNNKKRTFNFEKKIEQKEKDITNLLAKKEVISNQPKERKTRKKTFDIHPEISINERLNYHIDKENLEIGTNRQKYLRNVQAINVLKKCEEENRFATKEEQMILSEYVGWGGLSQVFDKNKSEWAKEYNELKSILTEKEYEDARASTLTAFYTPPIVIQSIYKVLKSLGFKKGNVLEPACGVGNFFGLIPEEFEKSKLYGIEVDGISGRIARQLYQKAEIIVDAYEKVDLPDNFFDIAIGNVPFGNEKINDKKYNRNNFFIHDYFFAKTIDKVRTGGVIAFITSKGTLDKEDVSVRKYIAQRADLLGAIRLPNNTFKDNAGTTVTSDIIFLQKRATVTDIIPEWVYVNTNDKGIKMNCYFIAHPEMILGEMQKVSKQYGYEFECVSTGENDLKNSLNIAIQNIKGTMKEYVIEELKEQLDLSIEADYNVRNFSYTLVNNQVYYRQNSKMYPIQVSSNDIDRFRDFIELRECIRNLIYYQSEDFEDSVIKEEQSTLNNLYDNFSKKYGLINSKMNKKIFADDSSYYLLCSLEKLDTKNRFIGKADIFYKRTIRPFIPVTKTDNSTDALILSISEKAKVDIDYMIMLTGKTEGELVNDLEGQIFLIPHLENEEKKYVTADEYLSGDVKEKLKIAKVFAKTDSKYDINVKYLEENQPKDVKTSEISVKLGTTWIPESDIEDFIYELIECSDYIKEYIKVHYVKYTSEWNISNKNFGNNDVNANKTYGTKRANAYRLIEDALNLRNTKIYDYEIDENGKKTAILNAKETAVAQAKQDLIKEKFKDWIWKDVDRRERLTRYYNDNFNTIRDRVYDGSHISFFGMNTEVTLDTHQVNAVAKVLYGNNALLAHCVGAGKTFEMVASAMESKRLGLCTKSLFIVPKSVRDQVASDFMYLYPSANILVAQDKDFTPANRKIFCSKISTGDYDAIIMGHSQFKKIPMSVERQLYFLNKEIKDIMKAIEEEKMNGPRSKYTVKQLEQKRKVISKKITKLQEDIIKDDVINFEELGIDKLFVDEAHYFKNLYFYTKLRNVSGISQSASQMSSDLFTKIQYLNEITVNRGVVFATGTPISNSMSEVYTMQRYLQYNELMKRGLINFDSWASTFGETVTALELAPEGTGYRVRTKFSKFCNLPELMAMFRQVADIKTKEDLNLKLPKVNRIKILVEPSPFQRQYMESVSKRADMVRNSEVAPTEDNMLKIMSDCKKMSLDQRLESPLLEDYIDSKINNCVKNVYEIWEKNKKNRATQLIFCDLSTPKNIDDKVFDMELIDGKYKLKDVPFTDVYTDIKRKLICKGIPKDEIVFIHEAKTDEQRKQLFSNVRKGIVRVLLGSTSKMGEGVNVQERVIALHHLDPTWKPAQIEQREGRAERQGNLNSEIYIYTYATKRTLDAYLYQILETKQKFIFQIMKPQSNIRTVEDVDEVVLNYAEIKALAADNPDMIRKTELDMEVSKLQLLKQDYLNQLFELQNANKNYYPTEIKRLETLINKLNNDKNSLKDYNVGFSSITINGAFYTDKEQAGLAILNACKNTSSIDKTFIGEYKGFNMYLHYEILYKTHILTLEREAVYKTELGTDIYGNITRIENVLNNNIEQEIVETKMKLEELKIQFDKSQKEASKPFDKEEELKEKSRELNKLNIKLSINKKDQVIMDDSHNEEIANNLSKDYVR